MDVLEKMGYASHIQQRYDQRRREEAEVLAKLDQLKRLWGQSQTDPYSQQCDVTELDR